MGINLGAFLGPLIAGYLAQQVDWHLGFACAGVGMTLGLVQYIVGRQRLAPGVARLAARPTPAPTAPADATGGGEGGGIPAAAWRSKAVVVALFALRTLFLACDGLPGRRLNTLAHGYVDV